MANDWGWDMGADDDNEPRYDYGGGGIDYSGSGGGFGDSDGFQGFGGAERGSTGDSWNDSGDNMFDGSDYFSARGNDGGGGYGNQQPNIGGRDVGADLFGGGNPGGGQSNYGGSFGGFGSLDDSPLQQYLRDAGIGRPSRNAPGSMTDSFREGMAATQQDLNALRQPPAAGDNPMMQRGSNPPMPGQPPAQQPPKNRGSNEWWDTTDFGNGQAAYDWMPDSMRNPRSQQDWEGRSIVFQRLQNGTYRPGDEYKIWNAKGESIGSRRNPQQEAALFQQMMGGRMPQGGMQQGGYGNQQGRITGGPGGFQPNYAAQGRVQGYGNQQQRPGMGGGYQQVRPQQRYGGSGGGRSGGYSSGGYSSGGGQQKAASPFTGRPDMFGIPNSPEWRANLNNWYNIREAGLRGKDWVVGGIDPTDRTPTGADANRTNTPWGYSTARPLTQPGQKPLKLGPDGYWYVENPNVEGEFKRTNALSTATYIPAGSNTPAPLEEFFKWKAAQQSGTGNSGSAGIPPSAYASSQAGNYAPVPVSVSQQKYIAADEAPMYPNPSEYGGQPNPDYYKPPASYSNPAPGWDNWWDQSADGYRQER